MRTRKSERGTRNSGPIPGLLFRVRRSAFPVGLAVLGWACGVGPKRCGGAGQPACVTVIIPRGASLDEAIDSLVAHKVVPTSAPFRIYARSRGLAASLKSGVYELPEGAGWRHIVAALTSGRGAEARFTLREGLTAAEVAEVAQRQLKIPRDSFLAATRDRAALLEVGLDPVTGSLEGYLFPTTYTIPVGLGARDLTRVMAREFETRWRPQWNRRLDSLKMTRLELVTLASIIEGEVRYAPDREYVSAVYHNRLKRGMALQADPTILYAHGRRLPRVWEKHLQIKSPYNTYRNRGLPPGPIGQPGMASLEAALYPKAAAYLYFVAQSDGKHVFSESYAQHLAAIRAIRVKRTPTRRTPPRVGR